MFYHFRNSTERYHEERLRRKEYAVRESINYFLREQQHLDPSNDSIVSLFDEKICELSKINTMDISIYSLDGQMLIASNPTLREKGLVSESLTPSLLRTIKYETSQVVVENKNDSMRYLSSYDVIHNYKGKPLAIVNVPYFDTRDIHEQDVQNFLMRLGEIYLLLFLISIVIAYFLSNYITSSLQAIGQKLKDTKINGINPPLQWRFDDEIGTLVNEYNRMLGELEKSAVILAQTERENAWKEMAKQVAHEIKNPLTPMRLNVQYLQAKGENLSKEKLEDFCEGMIDQIDALGRISDAFSRFATMPKIKKEKVPLKEIIHRITALYPDGSTKLVCEEPEITLETDKDQLIRVMNNLLANAFQSIPEGRTPEVNVSIKSLINEVLISVSDNGQGIAEEQREKIFEPKFTTKTSGMGLGLSMVKNIVTSLGGHVELESEVGKGSTFKITLPKA